MLQIVEASGRASQQAPIITRGAFLEGIVSPPWQEDALWTEKCRVVGHGAFGLEAPPREANGGGSAPDLPTATADPDKRFFQGKPASRASLPPRPKPQVAGGILKNPSASGSYGPRPQGAVTIKRAGYGAPSEKILGQVVAAEKARRIARIARESSPHIRCLGLEKDYAIFALVDAVSAAIGSCRLSADWEEGVLPAIDEIVDSMNDLFLGKAYAHRTASEFGSAIKDLQPQQAWLDADSVMSADVVFQVFVEGKECSTFQPLAVRNNALASLKEIASLTHEQMNGIYTDYMTATGALLLKDGGTTTENFERYYSTIVPLLKESAMLRCIHVMGGKHLVTFAKQKASSVPQDVLQKVIDAAELTSIQINEIWNLWYDCLRVMLHLKSREQQLQSLVQGAVQQAFLSPGMAANGVLLNAAAELKRNLETQARAIFAFNCHATMSTLQPLQAAKMHVASAPYFVRFHLLFLAGLFPTVN